jgi:hypothetical protein
MRSSHKKLSSHCMGKTKQGNPALFVYNNLERGGGAGSFACVPQTVV